MSNNTQTRNNPNNKNFNNATNSQSSSSSNSTNSSTNELIAAINQAKNSGSPVKAIRKQKHDPNSFYLTLTDGKQVGPVKVSGDQNELNRKFGEAQSFLNGTKNQNRQPTNAA